MTTTRLLIAPLASLAGSSAEMLARGYDDAACAVHKALQALAETTPHGRDYIGQAERLKRATAEHEARMAALHNALRELTALRDAVLDGQDRTAAEIK